MIGVIKEYRHFHIGKKLLKETIKSMPQKINKIKIKYPPMR